MKQYPKCYENYYKSKRSLTKCNPDFIGNTIGLDNKEYFEKIKKEFFLYQKQLFDSLIKIYWLLGSYTYRGFPKESRSNGFMLDRSYGVFMRNIIGFEHSLITRQRVNSIIYSYFKDFFPDFFAHNPFKEKMKFPYKYITLEYLLPIYQIDERIELLEYAEKNKISYAEFLDYCINYVNCFNDDNDYNDKINFKYAVSKYLYSASLIFQKIKK